MSNIKSPQSWKKNADRRRRQVLKSYRPIVEKTKKFKSRPLGQTNIIKRFFRKLVKLVIILIILGIIFTAAAFAWFSRELPKSTDLLTKEPTQSTKIYDRTGEILLNDINADFKRTKINLDDLPDYVKWATLVAEDRDFYSHHGIDLKGIARSILNNLFKGTKVGGSSISQQFIKNALLSPEKTYIRKLKELILTWQLERKFTKDEILEMYLNEIPYGGTAYGIEAASNKYFEKSAKDLTLAEAAALAALPQAPSYYSPYGSHKDALIWRKDWVLDSLVEEGYIPEHKAEAAKQQELEFTSVSSSILAPHFVFYARELIAQEYGDNFLEQGGLKIITTLNMDQQRIAEQAIKNGVEKNIEKHNARNAALVALNAQTGEITAMVGSADYFDEENDGAVNVATSPRQPGSSFKPIVYSQAFTKGYSPETILFDEITTFKVEPKDYEPHNYSDKYYGPVSMRKALAGSLNVPAVKTMYLVGVENILDLAKSMGYTTFEDRSRFGLSLVLGGGEVKLLEHVNGFATLAREGEFKNTLAILKIEDKDGKTLVENKPNKNKAKQVLDKQVTRQITNILSDNNERAYVFGAQNYLNLDNRPVATKTGTTNDYKDAWTMGFTPSLVAGVWVGNTRGEVMTGSAAGANTAAPIWREFMKRVFEETNPSADGGWEIKEFKAPETKDLPNKAMLNGQMAGEIKIKIDKITGKLATDLTPVSQIEEKIFREVHNILHYVNKNNPLGPVPNEPWNLDENYTNWEFAVEKWAKENGYETQVKLPDEKDDVHTPENQPSISIDLPSNNTTFTFPDINVSVSVSAKRGVRRVEYYLADQKIAEVNSSPFNLTNFKLIGFANGWQTLKAIAYDDVDNNKSDEIRINLKLAEEFGQPISFVKPSNGSQVWEETFPYPIQVNVGNYEYYTKIDFYIKNISTDSSSWIGYKNVDAENVVLTWTDAPESGNYVMYALSTDKYGNTRNSPEIRIEIK
ncbi:PBP1A family penicillin-binding protein [Patescibacteria group bacterium]|nr:PBP1A family penicillin-binding protein [Patescibacteria group bacterium]